MKKLMIFFSLAAATALMAQAPEAKTPAKVTETAKTPDVKVEKAVEDVEKNLIDQEKIEEIKKEAMKKYEVLKKESEELYNKAKKKASEYEAKVSNYIKSVMADSEKEAEKAKEEVKKTKMETVQDMNTVKDTSVKKEKSFMEKLKALF